ncbi:ABC transporter ATP-binding protein [Nocardiopsis tropica]|uniref:ABC transporter ATP-binding protein n=1 Tax=Nocardiopsis tropica TaxID=109330 RepID=A0ABU7KPF0_9ACTN|nr:ABC transporter ATP-binding protein [Nocardiopsis umidischolae]MEE2051141.1 ABC transporter ATP-binding protein [Nocardiopsis umidischolae]
MTDDRGAGFGAVPFGRFLRRCGTRLKALYLTAVTAWSTVYALPLVLGAVVSAMLDRAGGQGVGEGVWWLLAAAVALMTLRAVALWFGLQLTFTLIFRTSAWIRVHVLRRLLRRPAARDTVRGDAEAISRLRDDADEIGGLLEWTTDLLYRSVLLVVAVAVLALTDLVMTIPLVLLLGGLWASVVLKNRVAEAQAETRVRQGAVGTEIADLLTGIRDLRLADAVDGRLRALERRFAWRRSVQLRHQVYLDLLSDLFRNLVMVGTAVVLFTVSVRIADGGFSVGELVLFVTYVGWLGQQMYFFGKILARYQSGRVSYGRLAELAGPGVPEGDPHAPAPAGTGEPLRLLTVSGLTCTAPGGAAVHEPVGFEAAPGRIVAVTGAIGAGKSTLVRSLLGLQPGVRGRVSWNGADVTGDPGRMGAPRVGYARQRARFLAGTVRENLLLGADDVTDARLEEAMAAVHMRPGSPELPDGLDTRLDSGAANRLSGGQRQRLALARMLCRPADLYVVDDCDSSLDGATAASIWRTLPRRWPGAWIVVSHNPDLLAAADTVVTVRAGARDHAPEAPGARQEAAL